MGLHILFGQAGLVVPSGVFGVLSTRFPVSSWFMLAVTALPGAWNAPAGCSVSVHTDNPHGVVAMLVVAVVWCVLVGEEEGLLCKMVLLALVHTHASITSRYAEVGGATLAVR